MGRSRLATTLVAAAVAAGWASPAMAQDGIAQPGQAAADHAAEQPGPPEQGPTQPSGAWPLQEGHVPSYKAPPKYQTVVRGEIQDNDPIGEYGQPRWTAWRLFPTTRVYVVPAGTVQLEFWLDTLLPFSDPDEVRFRGLYELEIGLGHRLQLDLYLRTEQKGYQGKLELESEKLELRWALADWGVIPGNPTLYLELSRFTEGPMTLEAKVLLGGNLASRTHWGVNLVFERDLGGTHLYNQYGVTAGLSYVVLDRTFSLGAELQFESADGGRNDRGSLSEAKLLAGPSLQWRPVPPVHVDLVALFGGLGGRSDTGDFEWRAGMRPLLVVGCEL